MNDPGGVRFAAAHCLRRLRWFLTHSPLSRFCPVARDSKLQDHRVVHHPSMAAAVIIGSLKIWSHFENTRLLVIITLLRS